MPRETIQNNCCGLVLIQHFYGMTNNAFIQWHNDDFLKEIVITCQKDLKDQGKVYQIVLNSVQLKNIEHKTIVGLGWRPVVCWNNNSGSKCHMYHWYYEECVGKFPKL